MQVEIGGRDRETVQRQAPVDRAHVVLYSKEDSYSKFIAELEKHLSSEDHPYHKFSTVLPGEIKMVKKNGADGHWNYSFERLVLQCFTKIIYLISLYSDSFVFFYLYMCIWYLLLCRSIVFGPLVLCLMYYICLILGLLFICRY